MTIATTVVTAGFGMHSNSLTTDSSNKNSAEQRKSESEKSAIEFLRKQRQEAYGAFAVEANETYQALFEAVYLLPDDEPMSVAADFDTKGIDVKSHLKKLNGLALRVALVASEHVCEAANNEFHALFDAAVRLRAGAQPYVHEGLPVDDGYRKLLSTSKDDQPLQNDSDAFTRAAREDLSDRVLRETAKNCG